MQSIDKLAALGALAVIVAAIVVLIVTGHADTISIATAAIMGILTSAITVWRSSQPPTSPKPPPLPALSMTLALVVLAACGASMKRDEAKEGYKLKMTACVDTSSSRAEAEACVSGVSADYDDAGAPPAAKDGGK